jgi:hypothetical protein
MENDAEDRKRARVANFVNQLKSYAPDVNRTIICVYAAGNPISNSVLRGVVLKVRPRNPANQQPLEDALNMQADETAQSDERL